MLGAGIDQVRVRLLYAPALVHHHHLIGDVLHHAEVMGDEQVGQPIFILQVLQQVQDLGLDGHVQRGDGLVADEDVGLHREAAGDGDALALPTRELVGVLRQGVGREANVVGDDGRPFHALAPVRPDAMEHHGLGEDVLDGEAGVEGCVGVLENDLDAPLVCLELPGRHGQDVLAIEEGLTSAGLV